VNESVKSHRHGYSHKIVPPVQPGPPRDELALAKKSSFLPASFAGIGVASFNCATMAFLLERNHGNLLLGISGDFYKKP
jgi:hypothetical protein